MRKISFLFSSKPSKYTSFKDEDSASGSNSPRKSKSSTSAKHASETVDLSEVFTPQTTTRRAPRHPAPRTPSRLTEKVPPQVNKARLLSTGRPAAGRPAKAERPPLIDFLGTSEAHMSSNPALSRALVLAQEVKVVRDGDLGHLSMSPKTSFDVFAALVDGDPALALKFFSCLSSSALNNMLIGGRAKQARALFEQLEHTVGPKAMHDALMNLANEHVRASVKFDRPVALEIVLDACPSSLLPEMLKNIVAVDSNPDPLRGSKSFIDAWCKQDADFATAYAEAKARRRAIEPSE